MTAIKLTDGVFIRKRIIITSSILTVKTKKMTLKPQRDIFSSVFLLMSTPNRNFMSFVISDRQAALFLSP